MGNQTMNCDHLPSVKPHLVWVHMAPTDTFWITSLLEVTHELRKMGWRVTLVLEGPAGQQSVRGVEVLCIPKPQLYFLGYCVFHLRFLRLLAREWATIDVVLFLQMSALWILPLRLVRRLTGRQRPLLVMDTQTVPMTPREVATWQDKLRGAFYNLSHRLANRWADGQTANTQRMAEVVRIPPEQLWGVWPNGVNLDRFVPAQVARQWPLAGEPIQLVYVGLLNYERNLMTLGRAVEKVNAEGMAFVLSLIGDGTERLDLEKFALQTEGRVRIIPPVPHDQVPGLLAQAHVGVLPYPDEEKYQVSSPIKLFEYIGSGLPVLATRIFCNTDVVGSGKYVFWAEDASVEGLLVAMRAIWHDRASLGRMGGEAAIAAQAWTWQESARKLKTALERGL